MARRYCRLRTFYFDSAPRPDADVVETGAFTLFVSRTPWSYYARPARPHSQAMTGADLGELAAVCMDRHVDLATEWIHELHPELAELAPTLGLDVTQHALMTLNAEQPVPATTDRTVIRMGADEPALLQARAVMGVSFHAGPDRPPAGSGPSTTHDHRRG